MAATPPKPPTSAVEYLDLDDPELDGKAFLVGFRDVKVAVDRERLLQLLEREQELFSRPGPSPSRQTGPTLAPPPDAAPANAYRVTHASLSARIKKIHVVVAETQKIRPAHLDMLNDLLDNFDWSVPAHPNTRLDQHLADMATWSSTPGALKEKIKTFLKRYRQLRDRPPQPRGRAVSPRSSHDEPA
jgi:hypothetical protein